MNTEIASAVRIFEEVEKIRRGCEAKLTHLARNRRCMSCGKDWMPKAYEPCPECNSKNTRLMKQKRKCLDCDHKWQPSALGVCPWCGSPDSEENPRYDSYMRNTVIPRLTGEEDFYEKEMNKMIWEHPAWAWAKLVKGAGTTSIGRIIAKTDIHRLETISEMWAHCGFGLNGDGTPQRKKKGRPINYNVQLQSNCVMLGESLMRQTDSYYEYYLKQKDIHSSLTPAHCHNRSFRHMIKLFLAHFWQTWREAEGLDAPPPYAFDILKHPRGHIIKPQSMVKKPALVRKQG